MIGAGRTGCDVALTIAKDSPRLSKRVGAADSEARRREKYGGEPAAQRTERRGLEIPERRVPTGGEMLEVLQDSGVYPKAADDHHTASTRAVTCHRDRCRPGIRDKMLDLARKPGSHHLLRWQQRQDSEKSDATPSEHTNDFDKPSLHQQRIADYEALGKPASGLRGCVGRSARSASAVPPVGEAGWERLLHSGAPDKGLSDEAFNDRSPRL